MNVSRACIERTKVSVLVSFSSALVDFNLLFLWSDESRHQATGLCCWEHSWGRTTCLRTFVAFCDVNEETIREDDRDSY